jgi:hypothetical protein
MLAGAAEHTDAPPGSSWQAMFTPRKPPRNSACLAFATSKEEAMEDVIRSLQNKAFLFDDPDAYVAGVEDAVRALDALHAPQTARPHEPVPTLVGRDQPSRDTTRAV